MSVGGQQRHANVIIQDDGEMPGPIGAALQCSDCPISDFARRGSADAKEHDAARSRKSRSKSKFAEVFVKRDQETIIGYGPIKDLAVVAARCVRSDPSNIVAASAERVQGLRRKVLVG
jgi:hypothetical protein